MLPIILSLSGLFNYVLLYHRPGMSGLEYAHRIPHQIGEWTGKDLPVDYKVLRILETNDVLHRKYYKEGVGNIYLLIVFSGKRRKIIHPPEVCYMGSGYEVISKTSKDLKIGPNLINGNKLIVNKNFQKEIITYWYKSGALYTGNYIKQQLNIVHNLLTGKDSPSALIEVIMLAEDLEETETIMDEFTEELIPEIQKHIP